MELKFFNYESCFRYYTQSIESIKQARVKGEVILAKPILLLSVIDAVDNREIVVNKIRLTESLEQRYYALMRRYARGSQFDEPTKIDYTGKTKSFPSTIALNKLYYFMPYIKGKGVRDLYLIRIARIGSKAEIHPESNDSEPRLVFDLEYLHSLPEYVPVRLNFMRTYTDTFAGKIFKSKTN